MTPFIRCTIETVIYDMMINANVFMVLSGIHQLIGGAGDPAYDRGRQNCLPYRVILDLQEESRYEKQL